MGHYDDQIEEDYARQRAEKHEKEKMRMAENAVKYEEALQYLIFAKNKAPYPFMSVIDHQFMILEALIEKEIAYCRAFSEI